MELGVFSGIVSMESWDLGDCTDGPGREKREVKGVEDKCHLQICLFFRSLPFLDLYLQ